MSHNIGVLPRNLHVSIAYQCIIKETKLTKVRCNRSVTFNSRFVFDLLVRFIFWELGKGLIIFSGVRLCRCWRQTEAGWEGELGKPAVLECRAILAV